MRPLPTFAAVLLAGAAFAGDTQPGSTVTWHLSSEETCETGQKKFP